MDTPCRDAHRHMTGTGQTPAQSPLPLVDSGPHYPLCRSSLSPAGRGRHVGLSLDFLADILSDCVHVGVRMIIPQSRNKVVEGSVEAGSSGHLALRWGYPYRL